MIYILQHGTRPTILINEWQHEFISAFSTFELAEEFAKKLFAKQIVLGYFPEGTKLLEFENVHDFIAFGADIVRPNSERLDIYSIGVEELDKVVD